MGAVAINIVLVVAVMMMRMVMLVGMAMVVIMIVIVIVAAITGVAVRVIVVMVIVPTAVLVIRAGQRGCDLALDQCRLVARRILGLDGQRHDLGCQHDVVGLTEIVSPQTARTVEQEKGRRTLHLVGFHSARHAVALRLVDGHRER